jgi:hypothetical protein
LESSADMYWGALRGRRVATSAVGDLVGRERVGVGSRSRRRIESASASASPSL